MKRSTKASHALAAGPKRHERRFRGKPAKSPVPPPELYQRYYGFMLGFCTTLLLADFARPRYSAHRRLIDQVFEEIGILWRLPRSHARYQKDGDLRRDLAVELKSVGRVMNDFFTLGTDVFHLMVYEEANRSKDVHQDFLEIVENYALPLEDLEERVFGSWTHYSSPEQWMEELISRAGEVAAFALLKLPPDPRMCFVIMPFSKPFREYYSALYRPALARAGYCGIRAWEGVTNERYYQALFILLRKCGAALADVTAQRRFNLPNLNVVHEVGMNMGVGNVTFLICSGEFKLSSNFLGFPYMRYFPHANDWPAGQARQLARALREIQKVRGDSNEASRPVKKRLTSR